MNKTVRYLLLSFAIVLGCTVEPHEHAGYAPIGNCCCDQPDASIPSDGNSSLTPSYLLIGQSNAEGGATKAVNLTTPYIGWDANIPGIEIAEQRQCGSVAGHPVPADVLCGQEVAYRELEVWSPTVHRSFGPEMALGKGLRANNPNAIKIIKSATGGMNLKTHWNANPTTGKYLYPRMIRFWNQYFNPSTDNLKAVIWVQGEADAQSLNSANAYEANLTAFITHLRTDLGHVPFVIVRVSTAQTLAYGTTVSTAQDNVAAAMADVYIVNTNDLAMIPGDTVHYDADSMMEIGDRVHTVVHANQ